MATQKRLVVIAGEGKLPGLVSQEAEQRGVKVLFIPVVDNADIPPRHQSLARYIPSTKVGHILKEVSQFQADEVVMIGKVAKKNIYDTNFRDFDIKTFWLLRKLVNRNDISIFSVIEEEFKRMGITVATQTKYLEKHIDFSGILTKKKPTKKEMVDIDYGLAYAKEIARLDIGQTVVVKKQSVLAVEAIEGTDETVRRSKPYIGAKGGVVCKVEKPYQDLRFDIPTLGLDTLSVMKESNCQILAFEEKKTFLVNPEEMIDFANKNGIILIAKKVPPFTLKTTSQSVVNKKT